MSKTSKDILTSIEFGTAARATTIASSIITSSMEEEQSILILCATAKSKIICRIQQTKEYQTLTHQILNRLYNFPFGYFSNDFFTKIKTFEDSFQKSVEAQSFRAWFLVEAYFQEKEKKEKEEVLKRIEELLTLITGYRKVDGCDLFISSITPYRRLLVNLFLSQEPVLINLFRRFDLPVKPPIYFLRHGAICAFQLKLFDAAKYSIWKVLFNNQFNIQSIENKIIFLQRKFRAKQRYLNEIDRLVKNKIYPNNKLNATQTLLDVNSPYIPKQCPTKLQSIICMASKHIKLFSSLRHLTTEQWLQSILDDGLYGRRALIHHYLNFTPSALDGCDVVRGDVNAICCGVQEIDPRTMDSHLKRGRNTVEIIFDVNKIKKNPGIFFKQRDFGFNLKKIRKVKLADNYLCFSQCSDGTEDTNLSIYDDKDKIIAKASLPHFLFISYNFKNMQQILILNFFRYLDVLKDITTEATTTRDTIYHKIQSLSALDLTHFLTELGQKMTDTMEFNFNAAHLIDFNSIIAIHFNINDNAPGIKKNLQLENFIEQLEAGNTVELEELKKFFPNIVSSYRFLDYLIAKISNKQSLLLLQEYRNACDLPFWMPRIDSQKQTSIETSKAMLTHYKKHCLKQLSDDFLDDNRHKQLSDDFLDDNRHKDPDILAEYNRRFGMVKIG